MIVDVHAHLWGAHPEEDKKKILQVAEQFSVDKVMVSTLQTYVPSQEEIRTNNELTWGFMKEHPELMMGYCYLNPRNPEAMDELRTCVEDHGFCGVKFWTSTFCDDPLVNPIAEKCIEYDIPILIHCFYKSVDQLPYETLGENVAKLARRYPEAKLLMAHIGANCVRELRPVKNCPNVFADFSGSVNHADDLPYAVKMLGTDRVLFGTDMPDIDYTISYSQVLEADLNDAQKTQILGGNAEKLFKL